MTLPKTQNEMILDYMKTVGPITQKEAIDAFSCYRLGARIADVKRLGHLIHTEYVKVPTMRGSTRVARYSLDQETA